MGRETPAATPGFAVSVDSVTEREWNEILLSFDDANLYQTWAYGAVHWRDRQLSHLVLRRDSGVVAAAQLRIVQIPILRKGVAYLRWGPLWRRHGRPAEWEVVQRMTEAVVGEYAQRRSLLLRIIPACDRGDTAAEMVETLWSRYGLLVDPRMPPYRTFRVDLTPSLEEIRRAFVPAWRNKLNGAEKNGLSVIEGTTNDLYAEFRGVYHEMRTRKQFETTVDVEEFGRIQDSLPDALKMQIFLCRKDGKAVNAVVVASVGDTAIYLLGATNDEGMKSKGSHLLHWRAIQWLKARGVRWYDLGGVNLERSPGVYEFKQGLSGRDVTQLGCFQCSRSSLSTLFVKLGERLSASSRH